MKNKITTTVLGKSYQNRDIELIKFNKCDGPIVLLLAGVHGNESEGIDFLARFKRQLIESPEVIDNLYIIPCFNVDGSFANSRLNSRGVDLNRNLPTKDWVGDFEIDRYNPGKSAGSEIENKILMKLIEDNDIAMIFSFHSIKPPVGDPMINYNGHIKDFAELIAPDCNLPAMPSIGYPTPGCLGTWAGIENNVPTLTIELLRDASSDDIWALHGRGFLKSVHSAVDYLQNSR